MAKCQACEKSDCKILYPVTLNARSYYESPIHICQLCIDDIHGQTKKSD